MNRGDTVTFTVEIDLGNSLQPLPQKFTGVNLFVLDQSPIINIKSIDKQSWYKSDRTPGNYVFTYVGTQWEVNGTPTNLLEYGIYIESMVGVNAGDSFTLQYTKGDCNYHLPHGSYITFYLLNQNQNPETFPIVKKVFYTDGTVVTEYLNFDLKSVTTKTSINYNNVSPDGDFVITLEPDDTNIVPGGNYLYLLKLNYYKDGLIYTATISNKKQIYVIDDDYSGRCWNTSKRSIKRYSNEKGSSINVSASDIGAVSYEELQELNNEQQELARTNINAVNPDYVKDVVNDITLDEIDQDNDIQIVFNGGNAL